MSRFARVVSPPADATVLTEGADGRTRPMSLLAFDGPAPRPGDWLVVHSGFALYPADPDEAAAAVADLAAAVRLEEDPSCP